MPSNGDDAAVSEANKALEQEFKRLELLGKIDEEKTKRAKSQLDRVTHERAAEVAALGTVAESSIKGETTIETGGLQAETSVLGARLVRDGGRLIAADMCRRARLADGTKRNVVLISGLTRPDFASVSRFRMREKLISDALSEADEYFGTLPADLRIAGAERGVAGTESLGFAGGLIASVSNVLSYFRSDYKIGGTTLTPSDELLRTAVVQAWINAGGSNACSVNLIMPDLRPTNMIFELLTVRLRAVDGQAALARNKLALLGRIKRKVDGDLAAAKAAVRKRPLQDKSDRLQQAITRYERVTTYSTALYDSLLATGAGADELTTLLSQLATEEALKPRDSAALFLKVESIAGSYLIKKNLWTFFGSIPASAGAGAVINYRLVDVADGTPITVGVVAEHSGMVKLSTLFARR